MKTELEKAIEWATRNQLDWEEEKKNGWRVTDVSDLLNYPEEPIWSKISSEDDYRRGFNHGIAYAVEAIDMLYKKGFIRPTEISNILAHWNVTEILKWKCQTIGDVESDDFKKVNGHPTLEHESWKEIRLKIILRDKGCVECGTTENMEIDHIDPVRDGGLPIEQNLQVLCESCHDRK